MRKIGHYITNGFNKIGFLTINKPDKIRKRKHGVYFVGDAHKAEAFVEISKVLMQLGKNEESKQVLLESLSSADLFMGYYCETEEGVWYELYVNETIKSDYPTIAEDFDNIDSISYNFRGFCGLWLGDYEENSQITFFVPNQEKEFTFGEMTDIFI